MQKTYLKFPTQELDAYVFGHSRSSFSLLYGGDREDVGVVAQMGEKLGFSWATKTDNRYTTAALETTKRPKNCVK